MRFSRLACLQNISSYVLLDKVNSHHWGFMKKIPFFKISGSGNDFIIIDNRKGLFSNNINDLARLICRRRFSVGSDGLIIIDDSKKAHFKWRFYNADGSEVEMCGNGARCAARFANIKGIASNDITFETKAGIIRAQVNGARVRVEMCTPKDIVLDYHLPIDSSRLTDGRSYLVSHINTGVPHVVTFVGDLENLDVVNLGKLIRFHEKYKPDGSNANFVNILGDRQIGIRTYERGVEDETLSCGTGAVAASLISYLKGLVQSPVRVCTKGGEVLVVYFKHEDSKFTEVFLEGEVRIICSGELWNEALL